MPDIVKVTHDQVTAAARVVATQLAEHARRSTVPLRLYGVPRGGVPALYAILSAYHELPIVRADRSLEVTIAYTPQGADIIIDDLVDSGRTRHEYAGDEKPFFALFDKARDFPEKPWLVFPWEDTTERSAEDVFVRLLQYIGEDPAREGLRDTPARMVTAWGEWSSGYKEDPAAIVKQFGDGAEGYNEMVHVAEIPFYSHCEHHLAPFFGTVKFAYIPRGRVVGLSKMARLVDCFAKRLQVQERLTVQVVDAFCDVVQPKGAGCVIKARHLCMESRGVEKCGCVTSTSALRGVFLEPAVRAEFFAL